MKKDSTSFSLIICVILFVGFVTLACFSGAWPSSAFSAQILSALSGAVLAAIITLFLLQGQMASEEKKEKKSKIFEEKLNIYQNFMQELCDVVRDQQIDEDEEIRLQFQVASIAMHTSEKSILEISKQVKTIIVNIKEGNENKKEMLEYLFNISDVFHKELYNDATTTVDEENKNRMLTIQNFRIFLVNKADLNKYEEDCKNEIILSDRIKNLKSKIPSNHSKQWIYRNSTLVHEYFVKLNEKGQFIKSDNNIAMELSPIDNKFILNVFSRANNPDETIKILKGIGEGSQIKTHDKLPEYRHVLKVFNFTDSDDQIASTITDLLNKLKKYRDTPFLENVNP